MGLNELKGRIEEFNKDILEIEEARQVIEHQRIEVANKKVKSQRSIDNLERVARRLLVEIAKLRSQNNAKRQT